MARRTSDSRFVALTERALLARTHRRVIPALADLDRHVEASLVWLGVEAASSSRAEMHMLRVGATGATDRPTPADLPTPPDGRRRRTSRCRWPTAGARTPAALVAA